MTIDEAICILDPKTSSEALFGLEKDEAIRIVWDACRLACEALRAMKEAENTTTKRDRKTGGIRK